MCIRDSIQTGGALYGSARVEPHDLLSLPVNSAGKDARFRRSSPGFLDTNSSRVDAEFFEESDQLMSLSIIADHTDGQRHRPKRAQIVHSVGSPSGNELRIALIQHKHRC